MILNSILYGAEGANNMKRLDCTAYSFSRWRSDGIFDRLVHIVRGSRINSINGSFFFVQYEVVDKIHLNITINNGIRININLTFDNYFAIYFYDLSSLF